MNDAVTARLATPDDFEWLFDLHRSVFRSHIEQIWGWDEAWQRSQFRFEFDVSRTEVIKVDGQQVGYLQVDLTPVGLTLKNIALLPAAQGRGIGAHVVREVQRQATDSRVPVTLRVFHTNDRAAAFYERLGFRKTGQALPFIEMAWPGPA